MNTRSKSIASNTTADVTINVNASHTPAEPTQEDAIPPWARALMEKMDANNMKIDQLDMRFQKLEALEEPMPSWARTLLEEVQSCTIKLDQIDNRIKNLESLDESDFWEDNSPQIEIPKEPINDHLDFSNVVPSNDYYPRDMIDYQYNEVRVDIPMFKEVDDPKEYLNEDMINSFPKTTQHTNPTPRANSTMRCFKCRKVGHVKADCSKLIIVMDESNPLPTNDSKKFELEDEIYELDKAISIEHVHIIHDIVLKKFASSYERFKTFIAFPRRYKILKPSDLVDTKIHPPKLLKISFKIQLKNYVPFKLLLKLIIIHILWSFLFIGGISTSFTTLEFHESDIPIEMFSSPHPLEIEFLQNSFLSRTLVSNVGLIDMIIDHRTIITDLKEDD